MSALRTHEAGDCWWPCHYCLVEEERQCQCAMTEASMWACPVHGEKTNHDDGDCND